MRHVLLFAACAVAALPAQARPNPDVTELEARVARLEAALAQRPMDVGAYDLPERLTFCGQPVDLDDPWIRERMEKELLLVLGDRAQVALWTKRARRIFPVVEREAKALGTCDDLKYLAVVESGLRPAVTSRASAKGYWQFMAGTARQYGLDVSRTWDERADLHEATRAGLGYLKDLHSRFGDWPSAMAAYNTGPGRLGRAREAQGTNDYWQLDLYTEAERYVPRVIAVKAVMSDLQRYGFHLRVEDGWAPREVGFVKVEIPPGVEVSVDDAVKGAGLSLRNFRLLNPELGEDALPDGREVTLEVPKGKERDLRDWLLARVREQRAVARHTKRSKRDRPSERSTRAVSKRSVAKRSVSKRTESKRSVSKRTESKRSATKRSRAATRKARYYRVRNGDSLWDIAQKENVSVAELRRWNRMGRRSVITPGQKLVVRPAP
ncbi:MAG: transglycosylase SLT domain-containing protein [Myxococcales bacterium]|nr:transglycosylase SLT domain-containing protein [Myxococcales bacterium]